MKRKCKNCQFFRQPGSMAPGNSTWCSNSKSPKYRTDVTGDDTSKGFTKSPYKGIVVLDESESELIGELVVQGASGEVLETLNYADTLIEINPHRHDRGFPPTESLLRVQIAETEQWWAQCNGVPQ